MKTNIPDNVIPTNLSSNNKIISRYTTNVLIPRLGPLTVSRYVNVISRIVRDYQIAVEALKGVRDYNKKYDKWVRLAKRTPEWEKEDLRFEAPLKNIDSLSYKLVDRLSPFTGAKPDPGLPFNNNSRAVLTEREVSGRSSTINQPAGIAAGSIDLSNYNTLLRRFTESIDENIAVNNDRNKSLINEERWELSNLLHLFARDNRVISDLAKNSLINLEGEILGNELKNIVDKPELKLAELMSKQISLPDGTNTDHVELLLNMAVDNISDLDGDFVRYYNKTPKLKSLLSKYIWGYFEKVDLHGGKVISVPTPDETDLNNSREWAFQRSERLEIELSTPEFRGPISTDAVAPNSELTTSEVNTVTEFSGQASREGRSSQRLESHIQSYSKRFQIQLNNLTEQGIQNESEFSQNSTLFQTLREQRRANIDQVISQISNENEVAKFREVGTSSQSTREYITRGVDPNQAVTELTFQVITPVNVNVYIEDVSIVWCPRVISPFINLHRLVNDHMEQARQEYLDQNIIIDPVRPVEVYDKATFKREKHARGRHSTQSYDFRYEIPAEFSGWELDKPNCVVGFRNGTGDDYNWDEAWNWDDLENWNTYFQTLDINGSVIYGKAVLTTTDPEYFNRGFVTFKFGLKNLSEESRVALENYANERLEAEAQRQAVAARANQYARLRRDELIESYNTNLNLFEEAYKGLIRQIFNSTSAQNQSYYAEVIRSCINWDKAGIQFESGDTNTLPYPHLLPNHYLNTPAVRLTLPIFKSAEETFFNAIEEGAGTYHSSSANAVENYVSNYRDEIETLRDEDKEKLLLDSYDSELILGNHLEAVLSRTLFDE